MSQEECKGGDCPLRPQFEECEDGAASTEPHGKKVRLTTGKYVQLLIDARETDPNCWPPGLERAAAMLEQARVIEDECVARCGDFDPDKLSRAQSRQYFEIQLALDALQEEADDAPLDIEGALSEARHTLDENLGREESSGENPAPSTAPPGKPAPQQQDGFSPSEGFFASEHTRAGADAASSEEFFLGRVASGVASTASDSITLGEGWIEMPPLQRGDNYA